MTSTLIVLNPHAANGRAGKLWSSIEPLLWDALGELVIAVTQTPHEVAQHIHQAYEAGLTRVISIGGDGTNHSLVNALIAHNEEYPEQPPMEYGMLPLGTGSDWARSLNIPFDMDQAVQWIVTAKPKAVDVGQVQLDAKKTHFLNVASVGISGDVVTRVEQSARRPWSFLEASVRSLLKYPPPDVKIRLNGTSWYEGAIFLVAIANGTTFGRGMKIAPSANISDGLFDVVLVEGMPRLRALDALRRVYNGRHFEVRGVHHVQANSLEILSETRPIGMEFDGEYAHGHHLHFNIRQEILKLLV